MNEHGILTIFPQWSVLCDNLRGIAILRAAGVPGKVVDLG